MDETKVLEIDYAVCELDCETWTIAYCSYEPNSDWDHLFYTWIKGYLIDDDAKINTRAMNRKQAFFFEPLTNTWIHFREDKPFIYDSDSFLEEEKFMPLDVLDIEAPLKEKLKKLAVNILKSELVKKEFSKPYYGHGSLY